MADDLGNHDLIAFNNLATRELIKSDGTTAYFEQRESGCRIVVDDGDSQRIATLAGAGISINSIWNVHQELADGSLVRVLPDYVLNDQSALWLIYPKSNVLTAKVRIFIDFLLEKLGHGSNWTR